MLKEILEQKLDRIRQNKEEWGRDILPQLEEFEHELRREGAGYFDTHLNLAEWPYGREGTIELYFTYADGGPGPLVSIGKNAMEHDTWSLRVSREGPGTSRSVDSSCTKQRIYEYLATVIIETQWKSRS